jgi:hypothetical protein
MLSLLSSLLGPLPNFQPPSPQPGPFQRRSFCVRPSRQYRLPRLLVSIPPSPVLYPSFHSHHQSLLLLFLPPRPPRLLHLQYVHSFVLSLPLLIRRAFQVSINSCLRQIFDIVSFEKVSLCSFFMLSLFSSAFVSFYRIEIRN